MSKHKNQDIDKEIGLAHVFNATVPAKLFDEFHQLIKNTDSRYKHDPELSRNKKSYRCSFETYDHSMLGKWHDLIEKHDKSKNPLTLCKKIKVKVWVWACSIIKI